MPVSLISPVWCSRRAHLFSLIMAPLYDGAGDGGAGGQGGNGGSGGGNVEGGQGGSGNQPKMLTISEDEFEQRIVGRIKQAEGQWKKANVVSTLTAEERIELEQARKDREERARKDLEAKGQYEAATKALEDSLRKEYEPKIQERDKKLDGVVGRLRQEIVTNKLLAAAAAGNAYNAAQVVKLTESYVKLDDDFHPTVVDDNGTPRFVAGKPMTVEQLVDEWLKANPNHVKASNTGTGGGATGGASRTGQETTKRDELVAKIEVAKKKYRETRDLNYSLEVQNLTTELRKLDQSKAA